MLTLCLYKFSFDVFHGSIHFDLSTKHGDVFMECRRLDATHDKIELINIFNVEKNAKKSSIKLLCSPASHLHWNRREKMNCDKSDLRDGSQSFCASCSSMGFAVSWNVFFERFVTQTLVINHCFGSNYLLKCRRKAFNGCWWCCFEIYSGSVSWKSSEKFRIFFFIKCCNATLFQPIANGHLDRVLVDDYRVCVCEQFVNINLIIIKNNMKSGHRDYFVITM